MVQYLRKITTFLVFIEDYVGNLKNDKIIENSKKLILYQKSL